MAVKAGMDPFQALQALEHRRGGQVHPCRQFLGGKPGIVLQSPQDLQVYGIQYCFSHKKTFLSNRIIRSDILQFF